MHLDEKKEKKRKRWFGSNVCEGFRTMKEEMQRRMFTFNKTTELIKELQKQMQN